VTSTRMVHAVGMTRSWLVERSPTFVFSTNSLVSLDRKPSTFRQAKQSVAVVHLCYCYINSITVAAAAGPESITRAMGAA